MRIKLQQLFNFTVLVFVFLILSAVDWESLRSAHYVDRLNYIARLDNIWLHGLELSFDSKRILNLLFSEPAWSFLLSSAIAFTDNPEVAFIYIVNLTLFFYFCLFFWVTLNAKSKLFFLSFLILFNPLFIDFVHSQTRSALALTFVIFALYVNLALPRWILASASILTHTASILILGLGALIKRTCNNTFKDKHLFSIIVVLAFVSSLMIVFVLPFILQFFGDRRADYAAQSSSLLFSGFWPSYACYVFFISKKAECLYSVKHRLFLTLAVFLSFLFFFLSVFGVYGSRFAAMAIPLYFIALSYLSTRNVIISIIPLLVFQAVQFVFWL